MNKVKKGYVRCYWTGKIQLTNGEVNTMHCIQISNTSIEIETPIGLKGCKKSLLIIDAINNDQTRQIKVICTPNSDIFNEHDQHYVSFDFLKMSDESKAFVDEYIKDMRDSM